MLKKKIRSKRKFNLNTVIESHQLRKGDVVVVKFKDIQEFKSLLSFNLFEEVSPMTKTVRQPPGSINVVRKPVIDPPLKPVVDRGSSVTGENPEIPVGEATDDIMPSLPGESLENALERETNKAVVDVIKSSKDITNLHTEELCDNCSAKMIVLGASNDFEKGEILTIGCPICQIQIDVPQNILTAKPPKVEEKKIRVISKCSCGKRKQKTASMCKKCTAEVVTPS